MYVKIAREFLSGWNVYICSDSVSLQLRAGLLSILSHSPFLSPIHWFISLWNNYVLLIPDKTHVLILKSLKHSSVICSSFLSLIPMLLKIKNSETFITYMIGRHTRSPLHAYFTTVLTPSCSISFSNSTGDFEDGHHNRSEYHTSMTKCPNQTFVFPKWSNSVSTFILFFLELILGNKYGDFGDVPSQLDTSLQLAHLHFCLQSGRPLNGAHQHQLTCQTVWTLDCEVAPS